jgi:hypothetical protein
MIIVARPVQVGRHDGDEISAVLLTKGFHELDAGDLSQHRSPRTRWLAELTLRRVQADVEIMLRGTGTDHDLRYVIALLECSWLRSQVPESAGSKGRKCFP